jgi:hypothetical protein
LFLETTPETTINGNGNNNVNVKGNGNGDQKQPPPLSFSQIKNKITDTGYFLDDDKALEGLISKTDPSWFQEYSFIEFVAETVREGYADKPKRDRHNIFRKLLFDAANLREEYPEWRRQEKQKAEARAKKAARDKAEADAPKTCPICGKELGPRLWCPDGHGGYEFNEAGLKYDFVKQEPFDFSEMVQRFRKRTEVI